MLIAKSTVGTFGTVISMKSTILQLIPAAPPPRRIMHVIAGFAIGPTRTNQEGASSFLIMEPIIGIP